MTVSGIGAATPRLASFGRTGRCICNAEARGNKIRRDDTMD